MCRPGSKDPHRQEKRSDVAHIECILCNILRAGRVKIMKRLYKIHSKITLYKIQGICVAYKLLSQKV